MKISKKEILDLLVKYYPILSEKEAEIVLSISTYKKVKNKEVIFQKGRQDKKFFFLLQGSARSYDIVEGVEATCHLRSEGFIMGDARAFGNNQASPLITEAITDCDILLFDMGELEAIALKNSQMMTFYLDLMKEIIVVFAHRIHTFVTMDSEGRFKDLMKWNPSYLKSTFDKHLASFLGISPLTYLRAKKKSIK
jgi:CRP-like cAMP-binding protein